MINPLPSRDYNHRAASEQGAQSLLCLALKRAQSKIDSNVTD